MGTEDGRHRWDTECAGRMRNGRGMGRIGPCRCRKGFGEGEKINVFDRRMDENWSYNTKTLALKRCVADNMNK